VGQLIAVIVITDIVHLLRAGVQRKNAILAQFCICGIRKADRRWLQQNERNLSDIIASDEIRTQRGSSSMQTAAATTMTAG
jgi:hypothetical protein